MDPVLISLVALIGLVIVNIYLSFKFRKGGKGNELTEISASLLNLTQNLQQTVRDLKDEFVTNRRENAESLKGVREEVSNQLNTFTQTFSGSLFNADNL